MTKVKMAKAGATKNNTRRPTPKPKRAAKPANGPARAHVVVFLLALVLVAVVARAFVLQVQRNEPLKKMAEEQYLKEIQIPARRGAIYDRAGNALAVSNHVESVFAQPQKVDNARTAATSLAPKLGMRPMEIEKKLESDRLFVWLKRRIDPAVAADVKKLGLPFLGIVPETRRYYPNRALFSHLLGAVDVDGKGIEGLERVFEGDLAGTPQAAVGIRDARGRTVIFDTGVGSEGMQGSDVHLSVDREIQSLTEAALAEGVAAVKARAGSAIVLDPKTGDILALANYPEFNPNAVEKTPLEIRRNRAVTDLFEPGSTFKTILMASALEEGVIRPTDQVFCENGSYKIGGETIHDTHPHGVMSAKKILASSSNIGVAKIGVQLGRERFADYIKAFGFGSKTGIELPGEAAGIVRPAKKWPLIQLATVSFGQGISVNALQLAAAYGAVANGGILHKPRLVKMIKAPDGSARLLPRPPAERVMSPETAKTLNAMLQAAVNEDGGTGRMAAIDGVLTAGKTGTAQVAASGGYAADKYVSNFVGFAPAEAPAIVVVVVIDEPEKGKHLGGVAAAPVFKKIATSALNVLGLAPAGSVAAAPIAPPLDVAEATEEEATITDDADAPATELARTVPDFRGLTLREALETLKKSQLPLEPVVLGSGKIVSQDPAPGTKQPRTHKLKWVLASQKGAKHAPR